MGATDMERQALNVFRMEMLGAKVIGVDSGSRTLKDADQRSVPRTGSQRRDEPHVIGSVVGPHPFHDGEGAATRDRGRAHAVQIGESGKLPDVVVACVGGGSNAIGIFSGSSASMACGSSASSRAVTVSTPTNTGASLSAGTDGVLHGARTRILQEPDGLIRPAHSVSADSTIRGPDRSTVPGRHGLGRYASVTDDEALAAFPYVRGAGGDRPGLEPAHADRVAAA